VSDAATTVYLVRHAAHERVDRILCGRMPGVSLGQGGLGQAARLAERVAGWRISAVLTSPLERARETATPLGERLALPVTIEEGLNEIDFGAWTGRSFDELAGDPDWHAWNDERAAGRPPGGEAMRDVQARVVQTIESWRARLPGRALLGVGHGDVLKAALCWWLGLSLDRILAFDLAPASVSGLVIWEGGGKVLFLNDTAAATEAAG
jgi:probable phosphoglycerate mutase